MHGFAWPFQRCHISHVGNGRFCCSSIYCCLCAFKSALIPYSQVTIYLMVTLLFGCWETIELTTMSIVWSSNKNANLVEQSEVLRLGSLWASLCWNIFFIYIFSGIFSSGYITRSYAIVPLRYIIFIFHIIKLNKNQTLAVEFIFVYTKPQSEFDYVTS